MAWRPQGRHDPITTASAKVVHLDLTPSPTHAGRANSARISQTVDTISALRTYAFAAAREEGGTIFTHARRLGCTLEGERHSWHFNHSWSLQSCHPHFEDTSEAATPAPVKSGVDWYFME